MQRKIYHNCNTEYAMRNINFFYTLWKIIIVNYISTNDSKCHKYIQFIPQDYVIATTNKVQRAKSYE